MYSKKITIKPADVHMRATIINDIIHSLVNTCSKRYGIICNVSNINKDGVMRINPNNAYLHILVDFDADTFKPHNGEVVSAVVYRKMRHGYKLHAIKNGVTYDKYSIVVAPDDDIYVGDVITVTILHNIFDGSKYKCFAKK